MSNIREVSLAPLNPTGKLPPGLSAAAVASAYRSVRPDLRPKRVLQLMGIASRDGDLRVRLREAVDDPALRGARPLPNGGELPPLFFALYHRLRNSLRSGPVFDRLIAPAQIDRDGVIFIDPRVFAEAIETSGREVVTGSPLESESPAEALAQFVLAFGLLQPADAGSLIAPLLELSEEYAAYFGLTGGADAGSERPDSGGPVTAEGTKGLDDADLRGCVSRLRASCLELAQKLRGLADELDAGCLRGCEGLLPALLSAREQYESLVRLSLAWHTSEGTDRDAAPTLDDLDAQLDAYLATRDAARALQQIMRRAALLRHSDPALDLSLEGVRQAAHAAIEGEGNESRDGLVAVVELVDRLDVLSDVEVAELRGRVARTLGDEVAKAASRGRLRFVDAGVPDTEPGQLQPMDPPAVVTPETGPTQTARQETTPESDGDSGPSPSAPATRDELRSIPEEDTEPATAVPEETAAASTDNRTYDVDIVAAPEHAPALTQVTETGSTLGDDESVEPLTIEDDGANASNETVDEAQAAYESAWKALADGRRSLAYQIARTAEAVFPDYVNLPSEVVRALEIGGRVRSSVAVPHELDGSLTALSQILSDVDRIDSSVKHSVQQLIAAATLKPALLAPLTPASTVLASCNLGRGGSMWQLQETILLIPRRGVELSPSMLKGIREQAALEHLLDSQGSRIRAWLVANRQSKIIYAPTTDVWHAWLEPSGSLGAALEAATRREYRDVSSIKAICKEWSDQGYVENQLVRTDKLRRGRAADLRPIEARARGALFKHVGQAIALLEEWLALAERKPDVPGEKLFEVERWRGELRARVEAARHELEDQLAQPTLPAHARGAASGFLRAVRDLADLFDPDASEQECDPDAEAALGAELLLIPSIRLDESWEPVEGRTPVVLEVLRRKSECQALDWETAFDEHAALGDHLATARLLQRAEFHGVPAAVVEKRQLSRERHLASCRSRLRESCLAVATELARTIWYDLLPESTFVELKACVDAIDADQMLVFTSAERSLDRVRNVIREHTKVRLASIRQRMASLQSLHPDMRARLEKALADEDLLAANDFIDLAQDQRLPEGEAREDSFARYFPEFLRASVAYLQGPPRVETRTLINDVRRQLVVGPLDMTRIPGAQADEAARLLQSWFSLKNRAADQAPKAELRTCLEAFGFESVKVIGPDPGSHDRQWWCQFEAATIADREICVVPQFGSSAAGRYTILCTWDRPSEEGILSAASRYASHLPLLVFYFGQMTEQRRRDLAHLSRQRRRSLLVIDETVVFFVCGVRGLRLPVLFNCLTPFTLADPYITTASLVPPEMFFGRAAERESIVDPFGTSLIYGGRQLGKTALLRDVERRYHRPSDGIVVRWIDLRQEQIGLTRPIDDIWAVIASALQSDGVLKTPSRQQEVIGRRIQSWLGENPHRRIVLLLDEADVFLESDGTQHYRHLGYLKGLMDVTHRRFKVVFAGLHNVQRASRDVNTPLAHLGQAICVGPLLREAREAVALITRPLGALGYRFDSPDLPLRIASHTNYYPSLIQIYCKHLLEYLSDSSRRAFDPRESPPFVITAAHLEAVQNPELRAKMLDKFRLTLDLDPRYRVITLCIALATAEQRLDAASGVDASWVREEVMYWWAQGFERDGTRETLQPMLEEMVGLGILRSCGDDSFALRSPNLVNLLGTKAQIEQQLLEASTREPSPPYEPADIRRRLMDDIACSPLTAQQESNLLASSHGVTALFGTPLAGLADLERFLQAACGQARYVLLHDITDGGQFQARLHRMMQDGRDGVTLVVVPDSAPWAHSWVSKALEMVQRKNSGRVFWRVLFIGDQNQAWDWVNNVTVRTSLLKEGLSEMALRPWTTGMLGRWLDDLGIAPGDESARARIAEHCGLWWMPLAEFGRRAHGETHRWMQHLDDLRAEVASEVEWRRRVALRTEALPTLRVLAELGEPLSVEDIVLLGSSLAQQDVARALAWAELLRYVRATTPGYWRIDPFVGSLVEAASAR